MSDLAVIDAHGPGENVVAHLEALLERARAGELSSVAAAYVLRDGRTGQVWSKPPCAGTLLGSVSRLAHRLNQSIDRY